jgi:AraC-like DNA-binding protein/quercetin dioxygenase-like cupin family protein
MKLHHEEINRQPHSSFLYRRFILPEFHGVYHAHPEYELTHVVKSNGQRCVGNNISYFEEGDLVLLGPNLPHYWKNEKTQRSETHAESVCIQFSEDFLGSGFFQCPELKPIDTLLKRSAAGIRFTGETARQCAARMGEMEHLPAFERMIQLLVILKQLSEVEEVRLLSPLIAVQENTNDIQRIRKVYEYIGSHFRESITLPQVAEVINMTPPSFCRYFKKITRRTLFDIISEYRIQQACNLLLNTDMAVTSIGFECGYGIPAHFNNQFKKQIGLTPLQYRKKFASV